MLPGNVTVVGSSSSSCCSEMFRKFVVNSSSSSLNPLPLKLGETLRMTRDQTAKEMEKGKLKKNGRNGFNTQNTNSREKNCIFQLPTGR